MSDAPPTPICPFQFSYWYQHLSLTYIPHFLKRLFKFILLSFLTICSQIHQEWLHNGSKETHAKLRYVPLSFFLICVHENLQLCCFANCAMLVYQLTWGEGVGHTSEYILTLSNSVRLLKDISRSYAGQMSSKTLTGTNTKTKCFTPPPPPSSSFYFVAGHKLQRSIWSRKEFTQWHKCSNAM